MSMARAMLQKTGLPSVAPWSAPEWTASNIASALPPSGLAQSVDVRKVLPSKAVLDPGLPIQTIIPFLAVRARKWRARRFRRPKTGPGQKTREKSSLILGRSRHSHLLELRQPGRSQQDPEVSLGGPPGHLNCSKRLCLDPTISPSSRSLQPTGRPRRPSEAAADHPRQHVARL